MVLNILINKISYFTLFGFNDINIDKKFFKWREDFAYKQITYITAVTATMYILLGITNIFIAPCEILTLAVILEIFVIAPMLYFISYISYKKKDFLYVELSLFLSPIIAASLHVYIISHLEVYNPYQVELYLMIFWIYTLSGLRLSHSIITSLIIYLIGIVAPYILYEEQFNSFVLHTTWMSISMIFGFVGGYLLIESQKDTFLKQIQLEKMAIEDKLTGLYNRTKLDEVLTHQLQRSSRYNESIGLLIIDIDFFKSVNDTYGHLVGDKILVKITELIKSNLRSSDTLFRWGGEEFIILSLETHKEEAINIAQKIRKHIKEETLEIIGTKTISVGVTTNHEGDDINSIIKRADEALYIAKNSGRDCVKYI